MRLALPLVATCALVSSLAEMQGLRIRANSASSFKLIIFFF